MYQITELFSSFERKHENCDLFSLECHNQNQKLLVAKLHNLTISNHNQKTEHEM